MEFHYSVTLKGSKDTIEFKLDGDNKNDAITGLEFGFNSDNSTRERDRNGRIEMTLFGRFDNRKDTLNSIKQLSDWSKSNNDVYREVTIVLTTADNDDDEGNFRRTYHFDKMFCIDYFEYTGSAIANRDTAGLEFKLIMAQAPTYKISETKAEIVLNGE